MYRCIEMSDGCRPLVTDIVVHGSEEYYPLTLPLIIIFAQSILLRHTQPESGLVVNLDLQLYQIDHRNYLLDFECVNPSEEVKITINKDTSSALHPHQHTHHFTMEIRSRLITSLAQ